MKILPLLKLLVSVCLTGIIWLLSSGSTLADEEKGGYNRGLLENQVKFTVPLNQVEAIWKYMLQKYHTKALQQLNPRFTSQVAYETFTDQYFDDANYTLLKKRSGLRYRMLFQGRKIDKQFIQLKTTLRPRATNTRKEYKLNVNDQPDKHSSFADHPFLRLIRQADKRFLDSLLATQGITAETLKPTVEINQHRQRIYLQNQGEEIAYISLDHAYSDNNTYAFEELELALNEPTFTLADPTQKRHLLHVLELLQLDIADKFPDLRQDQTPKYNKMYNLIYGKQIRPMRYNLAWIAIVLVLLGIGVYLYTTRNRKIPEPFEII